MNTDLDGLCTRTKPCRQQSSASRKDPCPGNDCKSHGERQDIESFAQLNIKFEEDEMPSWTSDWTVDRLSDCPLLWN